MENTLLFMFLSHILQKETVSGADPEYVSEGVAAAAQKQLENFNKSMEMNAG